MKNQRGGINVGAVLLCAIGLIALVLAVFTYSSTEHNDFAEAKRIMGDIAGEVKGLEDSAQAEAMEVRALVTALTDRVQALEQKPLPAPQPPPVVNVTVPKELNVNTRGVIAIDVIKRAKPDAGAPMQKSNNTPLVRDTKSTAASGKRSRTAKPTKAESAVNRKVNP